MTYLLFSTTKGLVKKTPLEEYLNIRRSGLVAIKLDQGDRLLSTHLTKGNDEVMLVAASGKCIKFNEKDIRTTGRATRGVRGIKIKDNDQVVSMQIITSSEYAKKSEEKSLPVNQLLIVTENGYGKRTSLRGYKPQGRGGQGVFTAKVTKKTGHIVGSYLAGSQDKESDLLIISQAGKIIRLPLRQIPQLGRHTQGVKLIRLDPGDSVASLTLLTREHEIIKT
ncbi:hypothetical protein KJ596_00425 [Patescibacteria group bacterium]|nr:hypothetical protein [Patescibacteria group bacterium]MBU1868537.1 hypothetical protein [Patescibacteria group bacterium]